MGDKLGDCYWNYLLDLLRDNERGTREIDGYVKYPHDDRLTGKAEFLRRKNDPGSMKAQMRTGQ